MLAYAEGANAVQAAALAAKVAEELPCADPGELRRKLLMDYDSDEVVAVGTRRAEDVMAAVQAAYKAPFVKVVIAADGWARFELSDDATPRLARLSFRYLNSVDFDTPDWSQTSATVKAPASYILNASSSFARSSEGLPPILPRARAAASPSLVRSTMFARSNSAKATTSVKNILPCGIEVSTESPSDTNAAP